jgi:hypothetical protein
MLCSDKIRTIMSFIEEYINKLNNVLNIVICCNKDAGHDNDIKNKSSDINRYERIKKSRQYQQHYSQASQDSQVSQVSQDSQDSQSIYNDKNSILPKNAHVNNSSLCGICEDEDIDEDIDTIGICIDIDDDILKIKKELEESMSFKYYSDLHKSPRRPV